MSLVTPSYRAELSALLSRSTTDTIKLSKGGSIPTRQRLVEKAFSHYDTRTNLYLSEDLSSASYTPMRIQGGKVQAAFDETVVERLFGKCSMRLAPISIGAHPDFQALDFNYTAQHFCVSMFVDIVGSTKLVTNGYSLLEIRRIKDTILSLFIQVANFFGGHVHRLQGDAAFLQFVRVGQMPNDCAINALNSASLICYFVTHFFSDIFRENGLDPLAVRVGIDYGDDDQVLWSHYGLPGCSELTTTSTHTDLAAKLQAKANPNEIRIGANVRDLLDLPTEFFSVPITGNSYDYYIFPEIQYRQYIFLWQPFLTSYDFVTFNQRSKRIDFDSDPNRMHIICEVFDECEHYTNSEGLYNQNSRALPKEKGLKFRLIENQVPFVQKINHVITWVIENRGKEANAAPNKDWLEPQVDKQSYPVLETGSAFLGHHYLRCRIQRPYRPDVDLRFPVFVGPAASQQLLNS